MTPPGTMRVVKLDATAQHGTAVIAVDDAVWITVALPWWDLATRLWWWLCPHHKKAILDLTTKKGRVRTKAIRIAKSASARHEPGGAGPAPGSAGAVVPRPRRRGAAPGATRSAPGAGSAGAAAA